jgi:hypothetical protein
MDALAPTTLPGSAGGPPASGNPAVRSAWERRLQPARGNSAVRSRAEQNAALIHYEHRLWTHSAGGPPALPGSVFVEMLVVHAC